MLTETQYQQLAFLARLDASDPALLSARNELNSILSYMDLIQEVDLSKVEDLSQNNSKTFHERPDEATGSELSHEALSKFAPQWEAGHFVVPGIIQTES